MPFEVAEEQEPSLVKAVMAPDVPEGSERLLEAQRQKFDAEVGRAKSIIADPEQHGDETLYSEETLGRAITFLKTHIEWVWRTCGTKAPIPTIGPGPNESVDLYWKQPSWKLLVNIPADKDALATFYGDDYGRQRTKGSLDPNELSSTVVAWLM